jgi:hypothetical protein
MRAAAGFIAALLMAAAGAAQDTTTTTRTLRFAGAGERTLDVRALNGSIHVTGYDGADVQVQIRKTIEADTALDRREAEREVTVDFTDGAARVSAIVSDGGTVCGNSSTADNGWWKDRGYVVTYDFEIRVPRNTDLRLCTINGGQVHADDVAGDFAIDNVNGEVTLNRMRGSGHAHTVNGAIAATFLAAPAAATFFRTVNGSITATFPSSLSADLKMKTMHGGLLTDFDVEPLPRQPLVTNRRNGRYVYRSNDGTRVRVGKGGPEISFETLNGEVRVLRAAK